jgi:hypothetical protein
MNKTFEKYLPNGLLIGERKEKITTLVDGGIKEVFMTKEELSCLRYKYLTVGIIIFAIGTWLIMLLL